MREALIQVWDYAIDLKNFQEGSRDRILIPIVIAPKENNKNCHIELKPFEDDVYQPLVSNNETLKSYVSLFEMTDIQLLYNKK